MVTGTVVTGAAFLAALVATLILAAYFTPRAWWRRLNARALAVLAVGTFGIGSALLWLFEAAPPAQAAPSAARAEPEARLKYIAYDDLNLRTGTGVSSRRAAVVPAGSAVTPTGMRKGDWWEVSARVDGREVQGWVSSLWLRRLDERKR